MRRCSLICNAVSAAAREAAPLPSFAAWATKQKPARQLRCTHRAVKMIGHATDSVVCLETGRHAAVTGTSALAAQYLNHASSSSASAGDFAPTLISPNCTFGSITLSEAPRSIIDQHPPASIQANISVGGPAAAVTAIRNGKIIFSCRGSQHASALQSYQLDLIDGDILVILSNIADADEHTSYVNSLLNAVASYASTSKANGDSVDVESVAEDVLIQFDKPAPRTLLVARLGRDTANVPQPPTTIMQ